MKTHLYTLTRPGQASPFYVGLTSNLRAREKRHRYWFGANIIFTHVTTLPTKSAAEHAETALIAYLLGQSIPLENISKTPKRYTVVSEEQRVRTLERQARHRKERRTRARWNNYLKNFSS